MRNWCLPTGRWGEIRGGCVPGGSFGSLLRGGPVIPPGSLFGLGFHMADGWGQIFPKCPPPEKYTLMNSPRALPPMPFPHNKPQSPPVFPEDPPRTAVMSDSDSYGDFALPWDPAHVKICVHLSRMGSPFPLFLWSSCAQALLAFNARCSRGSFSECQI